MTVKNYRKVLENNLRLDVYQTLEYLVEKVNIKPLLEYSAFQQTLFQLVRLELVEATDEGVYMVTTKGVQIYNQINDGKEDIQPIIKAVSVAQNDVMALHSMLQDKLNSIIGRKQIMGFGNVPFIPSVKDLESFLGRFRKAYPELWDMARIEKCLCNHVTSCAKAQKYSPAIKYFIIKEGSGSQLAALLENYADNPQEEKQHKITNTKDLFE